MRGLSKICANLSEKIFVVLKKKINAYGISLL